MVEHRRTKYWHRLGDGRVQCDLCPRLCKLHEGQRGFCFVRACQGGQVVLTTYGRSSGFCVDPVEKKPLYHFLPGTPVLSFGACGVGSRSSRIVYTFRDSLVDRQSNGCSSKGVVSDHRLRIV